MKNLDVLVQVRKPKPIHYIGDVNMYDGNVNMYDGNVNMYDEKVQMNGESFH